MILTREQKIDKFFDMLDEDRTSDASSIIEHYRDWVDEVEREHDQHIRELAKNAAYRLARVARVPNFDPNGTEIGVVDTVEEIISLTRQQLPDFAKERDLNIVELIDVLEARSKEALGKGGVRFQAYPSLFVDRRPSREQLDDQATDRRDDEAFKAKQARREANKEASKPRVPILTSYGWKGGK